jgi:hypothetical protein
MATYPRDDGTTFLYWVNAGSTDTIGRVELGPDGEIVGDPDPDFIPAVTNAYNLAFEDGVLYWTRFAPGDENTVDPESAIGRAEIGEDGFLDEDPQVPMTHDYLTDVESPYGITVTGSHVYWTNFAYAAMGRAEFDATGAVVDGTLDNFWADDGLMPEEDPWYHPSNQPMFLPGGVANDGAYLYWTQRDVALWDTRADDVARRKISDPVNSMRSSFFAPPGIAWGIAVQRDTQTGIACPNNAGEVTCTLTVTELSNPLPETPAGQVRMSASGEDGTYPDGDTCILVPTDEAGAASCTIAYDRDGTGGELVKAVYLGSAEHGKSSGDKPLLPVPVVIPPDPDPVLPVPPRGGGVGGGGGAAPGAAKAKKCKTKKSKKARKKCKKKGRKK